MSRFACRLVVLVAAFGLAGCGKKMLPGSEMPGAGGAGVVTGGAGAGESSGGATGAGGGAGDGAIAGSGGGATGGSSGGGAIAGSNGGDRGGSGGGAIAGSSAGATGGAGGAGGSAAGAGGGDGPLRLVVFYTRWGTSYPDWWPTGSDRSFTMSTMLQPLAGRERDLIVLSGLTNASVNATSPGGAPTLTYPNILSDDAMKTLLTGRSVDTGGPAQGPSLDTVIGDCGGAAGPPLRLAVGQLDAQDFSGLSFAADGAAIQAERDPHAAATRVLGHDVTAPDPGGDIDVDYPELGAAQMDVAAEALAKGKTCAVTLLWGDQAVPQWLGLTADIHMLSHQTTDLYSALISSGSPPPGNGFATLQHFYAQEFASLLDRLAAVPLGSGTLLDRSVVVWISESGEGADHTGRFIPIVIAGGGGGRLDTGHFVEVSPHKFSTGQFPDLTTIGRTQADLMAALATLWGISGFGDQQVARQPLTEILLP